MDGDEDNLFNDVEAFCSQRIELADTIYHMQGYFLVAAIGLAAKVLSISGWELEILNVISSAEDDVTSSNFTYNCLTHDKMSEISKIVAREMRGTGVEGIIADKLWGGRLKLESWTFYEGRTGKQTHLAILNMVRDMVTGGIMREIPKTMALRKRRKIREENQ
jgi:hypothetical protein